MQIQFLTRCVADRMKHSLVLAAIAAGHDVSVLDIGLFTLTTDVHSVCYRGKPWSPVDLVYPFWAKRDSFLPLLCLAMKTLGQSVYKPLYREIPDKLSASVLFRAAGLPTPATYSSSTFAGIEPILAKLELPLILKIAQSSKGEGVFMMRCRETLEKEVQRLCTEGIDYVLQECVFPLGKDVRAFIINGRVFAAMERESPKGEFRANIALGAVGRKTELSLEEEALTIQACSLFGLPMAGVDFMRTKQGPRLLEVNREPGYIGIQEATGLDVAGEVVRDFQRYIDQNGCIASI